MKKVGAPFISRSGHAAEGAGALLGRAINRPWLVAGLLAVGVAFAPLGCGTATFVVQQYEGDPRPRHLISVLKIVGGDDALVVELDRERLKNGQMDPGVQVYVELLPGVHEIGIANAVSESKVMSLLRFRAEQGKFYRPRVSDVAPAPGKELVPGALWQARIFEVDRDTDEWLVDVTMAEQK